MTDTRSKNAKLNILASLACQIVMLICGFIVPRLFLGAFGSEAYGATISITNLLSIISLLDGGIVGVARATLYKPLADNDNYKISSVVSEIRRYFRFIAYIILAYVLVLACSYKYISGLQCFDWISTAVLVVVMSFSTFAQYIIGISNSVLLQAAQKTYVTQVLSIITVVLNMIFVVILINLNCSLIFVKLLSSCIYILKPIILWLYVKRQYLLIDVKEKDPELLSQKWVGLGQHIAYFLHSTTDISVLTILSDLSTVAVYSVYYMVIYHIQNITSSFSAGMEALFGDMLARGENEKLQKIFGYYDTMISVVTIILFSVTAVLIVPFIKLYTAGINDADYYRPAFAFILTLASVLYCVMMPYHSMTIAAGHFKQTKWAAYGEAAINVGLSVILVFKYNLIGVAIGTVVATAFRFVYNAIYLSKNIFNRNILLFVKRMVVNSAEYALIYIIGKFIISKLIISSYANWVLAAGVVLVVAILIVVVFTFAFYKQDFKPVIDKLLRGVKGKRHNDNNALGLGWLRPHSNR